MADANSWRTPPSRKTMIRRMEQMLRQNGITQLNSQQLTKIEERLFNESNTKEEYANKVSVIVNQLVAKRNRNAAVSAANQSHMSGGSLQPPQTSQYIDQQQAMLSQVPQLMGARGPYSPAAPSPGGPGPSPLSRPQSSPANVNTPAAPGSQSELNAGPSPATLMQASQQEEQMYNDKLKELSVYADPLKVMIKKLTKEGRNTEVMKLTNLLAIIQYNSTKTNYETLCKSEEVLKNILKQPKSVSSSSKTTAIPTTSGHWCQPLLTAVANSCKVSALSHALQRTFGPSMHGLYGHSKNIPTAPTRKRKHSESFGIPSIVQGELARLSKRFIVCRYDVSSEDEQEIPQMRNDESLHLQCVLNDDCLPAVPPLHFILPVDYPQTHPICLFADTDGYDSSSFLKDVKTKTQSNLRKLQQSYSLTALLQAWATGVKQACVNLDKTANASHAHVVTAAS